MTALRREHATWCTELAAGTGADTDKLRELNSEEANLRAAIEWSLDTEPAWVAQIITPTWGCGLMREARDWLRQSVDATDDSPDLAAATGTRGFD